MTRAHDALDRLLDPDTLRAERARAAWAVLAASQPRYLEVLLRHLALWRRLTEWDGLVEARRIVAHVAARMSRRLGTTPRALLEAPNGILAVGPRGRSGTIGPPDVYALYDHHREWPLDGRGVRHAQLFAETPSGLEPLRSWLTRQETYVLCPRCGALLNFCSGDRCPAPFEHVVDWYADDLLCGDQDDPIKAYGSEARVPSSAEEHEEEKSE